MRAASEMRGRIGLAVRGTAEADGRAGRDERAGVGAAGADGVEEQAVVRGLGRRVALALVVAAPAVQQAGGQRAGVRHATLHLLQAVQVRQRLERCGRGGRRLEVVDAEAYQVVGGRWVVARVGGCTLTRVWWVVST